MASTKYIEKERDIKDTLYAKLSEELKLVTEERDKLKTDLSDKRKEAWELEYKLKQQLEDKQGIYGTESKRKGSIDNHDRATNGKDRSNIGFRIT